MRNSKCLPPQKPPPPLKHCTKLDLFFALVFLLPRQSSQCTSSVGIRMPVAGSLDKSLRTCAAFQWCTLPHIQDSPEPHITPTECPYSCIHRLSINHAASALFGIHANAHAQRTRKISTSQTCTAQSQSHSKIQCRANQVRVDHGRCSKP